jgi:hypothetical protein
MAGSNDDDIQPVDDFIEQMQAEAALDRQGKAQQPGSHDVVESGEYRKLGDGSMSRTRSWSRGGGGKGGGKGGKG